MKTDFEMPLNTYLIGAPGSGKSVAFQRVILNTSRLLQQDHNINVLVETYSSPGLHRHYVENDNYCLVSSDEGSRILSTIAAKEAKNEVERALMNKLWTGCGDTVTLKDGERDFSELHFPCAFYTTPALNLLSHQYVQRFRRLTGSVSDVC